MSWREMPNLVMAGSSSKHFNIWFKQVYLRLKCFRAVSRLIVWSDELMPTPLISSARALFAPLFWRSGQKCINFAITVHFTWLQLSSVLNKAQGTWFVFSVIHMMSTQAILFEYTVSQVDLDKPLFHAFMCPPNGRWFCQGSICGNNQ